MSKSSAESECGKLADSELPNLHPLVINARGILILARDLWAMGNAPQILDSIQVHGFTVVQYSQWLTGFLGKPHAAFASALSI